MDIRPDALAAFDAEIDLETAALAIMSADRPTPQPGNNNQSGNTHERQFAPLPIVQITCAANITPEPISWLWNGWLARGKLHIFAGQAGTGKTTIAIALAATVSLGGRFPDGSRPTSDEW